MIPKLSYHLSFPNPLDASPEGIVAYGGDLSPSRLMLGYRNGIFPWYSVGDPILWWSPNPRLILELTDFKLHRSLRKKYPNLRFDLIQLFHKLFVNVQRFLEDSSRGVGLSLK